MVKPTLHLYYYFLGIVALLLGQVDFMVAYLFWFVCGVILLVSRAAASPAVKE